MRAQLGYDRRMRHWMLVLPLALVSTWGVAAYAQSNGVPPSVTSYGFGGHPDFGGVPPSVTSVGPKGPGPVRPFPVHPHPMGSGRVHQPPVAFGTTPGHHHDHNQTVVYPYFIPYYQVVDPYAYGGPDVVEGTSAAGDDPENPAEYQGGPTIFDRRGSGSSTYANDYLEQRPRATVPKPDPTDPAPEAVIAVAPTRIDPKSVSSQPNTLLIFKDGHTQEVGNYAIVGTNLFDLTPGRRQKIALDDLDLPATQKANDDRGIDFKLPELPSGN
jgi:hypothetical protein